MKNHYEDATSLIIPRNVFDRGEKIFTSWFGATLSKAKVLNAWLEQNCRNKAKVETNNENGYNYLRRLR